MPDGGGFERPAAGCSPATARNAARPRPPVAPLSSVPSLLLPLFPSPQNREHQGSYRPQRLEETAAAPPPAPSRGRWEAAARQFGCRGAGGVVGEEQRERGTGAVHGERRRGRFTRVEKKTKRGRRRLLERTGAGWTRQPREGDGRGPWLPVPRGGCRDLWSGAVRRPTTITFPSF
jgi:hypothetical protein